MTIDCVDGVVGQDCGSSGPAPVSTEPESATTGAICMRIHCIINEVTGRYGDEWVELNADAQQEATPK